MHIVRARRPLIGLLVAAALLTFASALPRLEASARQARGGAEPDLGKGGTTAALHAPVGKPSPAVIPPPPGATVTRMGFCGGDDWEPDISTSGTYVYVVWTHYAGNTACDAASGLENRRVYIEVSSDGGATFGQPHVVAETPGGKNYPSQVDSTITVSDNGNVYVGILAYGLSGSKFDVAVARSQDHGATFPLTRIINGGSGCVSCDHEFGVAKGNDVYFAYTHGKDHFISHSSDGGLTWTEAKVATYDVVGFAEDGVIDGSGNAWFAWADCQSSNCTGSPASDYRVSKTLAGTTTTTFSPIIGQSPQGPPCPYSSCGFAYFGAQDDIAIDAAGTLYLAYQDGQSHTTQKSPTVIQLSKCSANCTAGGWTAVGRVDDKTAQNCTSGNCYALYPRIDAGAAGTLTAMWMDDRNDSIDGVTDHVDGWNVYTRTSTNGGATWTTPGTQLSVYDPAQAQSRPNGFLFPYGDYMDLAKAPACPGKYAYTWGEGFNWVGGATNPGHVEFRSTC